MWEDNRNWERAVDNYLEITEEHFEKHFLLEIWNRIVRISKEYLPHRSTEII